MKLTFAAAVLSTIVSYVAGENYFKEDFNDDVSFYSLPTAL